MGKGDKPPLPNLDCLIAPSTHNFAFKGFVDCNWLQLLEVSIDPAHASFLHRFLEDEEDATYGQQFRNNIDNISMTKLFKRLLSPGDKGRGY